MIKDLLQAEAISVTFDAWTAKNSTHSLLSFTAHFVQNSVPEFRVISAKPIKGRHNAIVLEDMIREILAEFTIPEDRIFIFVRDAAEVMVKVCSNLGFRSLDCFAHKLNLVILFNLGK